MLRPLFSRALPIAVTLSLALASCGTTPAPDATAPTVEGMVWNATRTEFAITANDDRALSRLTYRLNDGAPTTVAISGKGPHFIRFSQLPAGRHTLRVTVQDEAGNTSAEQTREFLIGDVTAPTGVTLGASTSRLTTAGAVTLSAAAQDDVAVTRIEFREGTTVLGVDETPADGFRLTLDLDRRHQGERSYTAVAYDASGNASAASAPVNVTVDIPAEVVPDTTAPTISDTSFVTQTPDAYTATANIAFGDDRGVVRLRTRLNGLDPVDHTLGTDGPFTLALSDLSVGVHTLVVTVFDAAGNSAARTLSFTVGDVTDPTVSRPDIRISPVWTGSGYGVTAALAFADNVGVTALSATLDNDLLDGAHLGGAALTTEAAGHVLDLGVLGLGRHTLVVTVTDQSGRTASTTLAFDVTDTTAPTGVTLTPSATSVTVGQPLTLTATADDNVGATKAEFLRGNEVVATDDTPADGFTTTLTFTNEDAGTRTYSVRVYDAAGNHADASTDVTVTVDPDTTAPTVTGVSARMNGNSRNASMSATVSDDFGVTSVRLLIGGRDLDITSDLSGTTLSATVKGVAPGNTFTLVVTDGAGNSSEYVGTID